MNTPFQIFGTYEWKNASGGIDATLIDPMVTVREGTESINEIMLDVFIEDENDSFSFPIMSNDPPTPRSNAYIKEWAKDYIETIYKQ